MCCDPINICSDRLRTLASYWICAWTNSNLVIIAFHEVPFFHIPCIICIGWVLCKMDLPPLLCYVHRRCKPKPRCCAYVCGPIRKIFWLCQWMNSCYLGFPNMPWVYLDEDISACWGDILSWSVCAHMCMHMCAHTQTEHMFIFLVLLVTFFVFQMFYF